MSNHYERRVGKPSPVRWGTHVALPVLVLFSAIPSSAAPPAPWAPLHFALERGYQPELAELPQLAMALADSPSEVLIAWDRHGRFLFHAVGDRHRVQLPRSVVRQLEGSVVIHNHPRGLPPSPRDVDTVLRYRLRRLYVAARIDGVVSLIDIGSGEALRWSRQGGFPPTQARWRPVVTTASELAIEEPVVRAARFAYSLLGAWL